MSGKRKRGHNREIMYTTWFFAVLFVAMMGYLVFVTVTGDQETMINNGYNTRQKILLSKNYRGTIYAKDGEILARTLLDDRNDEIRQYPYGELFSHIVGYSTKGRTGVEALGNYYLINSNIPLSKKASNSMTGRKNQGDAVYTTLDVSLQQIASDALGSYNGAIVVTEVKTGKILALVSKPGFDPNEIDAIWNQLIKDTESSVLLNRATQGLYPPGSTFKIITALEYIRENPTDYNSYNYLCNGNYQNGNDKIRCYHGTKHGSIDFITSFVKSCNASFANIGMTLNRTNFADTLTQLLFDEPLPLTLPYAKSSVTKHTSASDADMMQTAIGQGKTQITPMHLNMITAAIANRGLLMKPYVMDRIESDTGEVIKLFESESYKQIMTSEEAAVLTEMMAEVVESGTARKLKNDHYTAAGKTGSAEYNSNKSDSHAWFTGFAPVEDPEVCVTIIVEGVGSGGDYAVPMVRRIMDGYFVGDK